MNEALKTVYTLLLTKRTCRWDITRQSPLKLKGYDPYSGLKMICDIDLMQGTRDYDPICFSSHNLIRVCRGLAVSMAGLVVTCGRVGLEFFGVKPNE